MLRSGKENGMYQPIGNSTFVGECGFARSSKLPRRWIKNMATSLLKPLVDEVAVHAACLPILNVIR